MISGVTSQSLNDVFSATYDNYRILIDLDGTTSTDSELRLRFRVSGTDDTSNNYAQAYVGLDQAGGANNLSGSGTSLQILRTESTAGSHFYSASLDIFRPQKAEITVGSVLSSGVTAAGNYSSFNGAFLHNVATAYTGITFFAGFNIAGKVRVYGYNQ